MGGKSAEGHLQTFRESKRKSALPPESGHRSHAPHGLLWANFGHRQLFNNLISAGKERRRYSEPECLGRLEVDHQLVFGRALHWKVGGLLTLKDAIHVASSFGSDQSGQPRKR